MECTVLYWLSSFLQHQLPLVVTEEDRESTLAPYLVSFAEVSAFHLPFYIFMKLIQHHDYCNITMLMISKYIFQLLANKVM